MLQWLKSNGRSIGLIIHLDEIFHSEFKNHYRAWAEISWYGQMLRVQGIAESAEKAILVCLSEFIERAVVLHSRKPNSSGFAAHSQIELAQENAKNEIFEHDAFFCHALTFTPFNSLNLTESLDKINLHLANFLRTIRNRGVEIKLAEMKSVGRGTALIAAAAGFLDSKLVPLTFETVYGRNQNILVEKVLFNLSSNLQWFAREGSDKYRLRHAERTWFAEMFREQNDFIDKIDVALPQDWITFEELNIPRELRDPPLKVVRAQCDILQPYIKASFPRSRINLDRLSSFSKRTIAFEDLADFIPSYN